ncbi:MAG: hypothetical protein IKP73_00925 [Bacteroidales bacterium]|nr:hypothetical protein [Bacteroidales bacterium]
MQLAEIIEQDKRRGNIFECHIAKMYRDGMFLRAYNWSAWLFVKSGAELKISNRTIKKIDEPVAMVGFPQISVLKFLGRLFCNFPQNLLSLRSKKTN